MKGNERPLIAGFSKEDLHSNQMENRQWQIECRSPSFN